VSDQETASFLNGENLSFIEQLYQRYLDDPDSVDASWEPIFEEYLEGERDAADPSRPSFTPRSIFAPVRVPTNGSAGGGAEEAYFEDRANRTAVRTPGKSGRFAANVRALVHAYRLHGHLIAEIDPLERPRRNWNPPELDPSLYGFTEDDMDAEVRCEALFGDDMVTLGEVLERLRELYCSHIAVEYQYIPYAPARDWLRTQIERHHYAELEDSERRAILERLIAADSFESFLHKKYYGAKRFSVTGGDSLIPMLDSILEVAGQGGVREILLGMAHRGRLNVLHNTLGKPAEAMLAEFEKNPTPEEALGRSDVKYHMGYSSDYTTRAGDELHLSLAFNPSHLEFVNPVVLGRARAKQDRLDIGSEARQQIMPLLLHGDAAFAGQGIVAESLNISRLPAYTVGGALHIVINNQIGFTAVPFECRSTTYATDVAKMLEVPIFHVNADDPEACVRAAKIAMRYRQKFGQDVIIDLVCFRRYGHNEGDDPNYTQPLMYQAVDDATPVREKYASKLVDRGVVDEETVEQMWDDKMEAYDEAYENPRRTKPSTGEGLWDEYHGGDIRESDRIDTTVERERLQELGHRLLTIPDELDAHRTIQRIFKRRREMVEGEVPLDWAMGEALAYSTLLVEGTDIRLSGQDSVRGTFSHRHAAIYDSSTGEAWWPARHLADEQGSFEAYNSLLSENAVLGFEYGYSLDSPDALVMWEAQFGDFANGAQVIIDQFINSGEDKWRRLSGLVMLLPHGYEGQGPEHSSARLERYLQLCAEDNMFVCNLTKPSQIFHLLRRQVHSPVRKPLIVMSPKKLLRYKRATSELSELSDASFRRIIPDERDAIDPEAVERVLLCSGKVYYDLLEYAEEREIDTAALVRVEQLYPLDREELKAVVARYPNRKRVAWVQEEPKNMGAWSYIFPHLIKALGTDPMPAFVGRVASASPATGDPASHELEQQMLVEDAFDSNLDEY
jgi:2-oxoglutarate dehydrogenase E1 component